ncbi:MAG: YhcH/YjgK/YiaL family protein [Candidatus Accumulibacter sp.]|jgi:biofilm protein TabA|nr:YhcH/YjgK/YiaL family protein [Accumulibacter sp.]
MILGRLSDLASHEKILPPVVFRALKTIHSIDPKSAATGRFPIEGEKLYYTLEDRPMRTEKEHRAEAHKLYADIHLPLSSSERFGFALPQPGLPIVEDLTEARDLAFYADPANEAFLIADPGSYLVFLPGELHRPCLAVTEPGSIRKIVIKIHADLLGLPV